MQIRRKPISTRKNPAIKRPAPVKTAAPSTRGATAVKNTATPPATVQKKPVAIARPSAEKRVAVQKPVTEKTIDTHRHEIEELERRKKLEEERKRRQEEEKLRREREKSRVPVEPIGSREIKRIELPEEPRIATREKKHKERQEAREIARRFTRLAEKLRHEQRRRLHEILRALAGHPELAKRYIAMVVENSVSPHIAKVLKNNAREIEIEGDTVRIKAMVTMHGRDIIKKLEELGAKIKEEQRRGRRTVVVIEIPVDAIVEMI